MRANDLVFLRQPTLLRLQVVQAREKEHLTLKHDTIQSPLGDDAAERYVRRMQTKERWPSADSRLDTTIDITVPYADANRDQIVSSEWRRQGGGEVTPVPALTLPRRTDGSYTVRMRMKNMADLVLQDMYSEEIA